MKNISKKQLVKRCAALSHFTLPFFITASCLPFIELLFTMIGEIGYDAENLFDKILWPMLIFDSLYMCLWCYCYFKLVITMNSRKWKSFVYKAQTRQKYSNDNATLGLSIGAMNLGGSMNNEYGNSIQTAGPVLVLSYISKDTRNCRNYFESLADSLRISVPSVKKFTAMIILVPIVVMTAINIQQTLEAKENKQKNRDCITNGRSN